jgi:hypothetical protein
MPTTNSLRRSVTSLNGVRILAELDWRQTNIQNAYNKFLTPLGDVLEWCKASCGAGLTTNKIPKCLQQINSLRRSVTSLNGVRPLLELAKSWQTPQLFNPIILGALCQL